MNPIMFQNKVQAFADSNSRMIWKFTKIPLLVCNNMISEKTIINTSSDTIWNHLRTLQGAEQYIPVVTKSEVSGNGLSTKRTCDVQMGDQSFQLSETLVKLDDSQKSMAVMIDDAPPPMKGLLVNFSVTGSDNSSELQVSVDSEPSPENKQMIGGILNMICSGLKQFHEK